MDTGSTAITLRPMRLEDVAQVHAVDQLSFALPWSERSFRFELNENPNSLLWVAEVKDENGASRVVGMIVVWIIVDEAHVGTIAVHPDYRRLHVGQKLLAQSLLAAMERGAVQSLLEVRRGNLGAQAMYLRFGYEVVGERPHYYQDNKEDALLMTLSPLDEVKLRAFLGSSTGMIEV
ncbi:MAG: ribosomal protein S18-alanine N-acetyltransferase [Anaerolineaceae bacterium]